MSTYFLTGASGAVGSAIVPLLLADPATKLRILLRARTPAHLEERFQSLCEFWRIAPENADRRRIEPLPGDAALPQFGLSAVDYARVCEDTTHVIHCAASVRMNETLDEARASAIGSAREVLTLA
ncbi:MAG: SDR family oxidoreductase, partial [Thauera sp.]